MQLGPMETLVDQIYEAAVVPELWPQVLTKLAHVADGVSGLLMTGDLGKWVASPDAVEIVQDYLDQGWHSRTQRTNRLFQRGVEHPGFVCDLDVFSPEEIEAEPVYREFFRPRGWGWGAGTIIAAPSGDLIAIDIERRYERGPMDLAAVQRLDGLRPHLARAALISGRLALERMNSATQILDIMGLGGAVLGAGGKLLSTNARFELLLGHYVMARSKRVAAINPLSDNLLAEALNHVCVPDGRGSVRSIPLPGTEGHPPAILHLVPIRGAAHDIFSGAVALLVITQMTAKPSPAAELLQGLFDLTAAEARVARAIANRQTVNEIASSLQLSPETVRTQLKSVLSKTGQTRQLDLAVLLTSSLHPEAP